MEPQTKTAVFAGGCFWCVESDFYEVPGVSKVISGYAGGTAPNPTYETYAEGGYREAVEVTYDPTQTTFGQLVEHLITHIDPTDGSGSFFDRGAGYTNAIYYESDNEQKAAEEAIARIDASGVYEKPLVVPLVLRTTFYPAEGYHQGYAKKNPAHYKSYRVGSGRDAFVKTHLEKLEDK